MSIEETVSSPVPQSKPDIINGNDTADLIRSSSTKIHDKVEGKLFNELTHTYTNLFRPDVDDRNAQVNTSSAPIPQIFTKLHEGVKFINPWKLVCAISSKVLYFDEDHVLLECLIDKEEAIYEEREFPIEDFEGLRPQIGKLFKICVYRRLNSKMIEILDGKNLVDEDDFPKIDFYSRFSGLNLNQKID